jgi:hypothetical protein
MKLPERTHGYEADDQALKDAKREHGEHPEPRDAVRDWRGLVLSVQLRHRVN